MNNPGRDGRYLTLTTDGPASAKMTHLWTNCQNIGPLADQGAQLKIWLSSPNPRPRLPPNSRSPINTCIIQLTCLICGI